MDREYLWMSPSAYHPAQPDGKFLFYSTTLQDELPIIINSTPEGRIPPVTLNNLFTSALSTHSASPALRYKVNNSWRTWTYAEYFSDTIKFGASLLTLGLKDFSTINIIGFNSPQWVIGYLGAISSGCVPVGVYTSNGIEACEYIVSHSESQLILVQNELQLKKYLDIWLKFPEIKAIVVYWPGKEFESIRKKGVFTWDEFLLMNDEKSIEKVKQNLLNQRPNQCASIIYTSGTTGPPKGVMVTQDNLIWSSASLNYGERRSDIERKSISYLPLSHVASQVGDIWTPLVYKGIVTFADENALLGTLGVTIKETRPTNFFGVPRIFEKFEEKLRAYENTLTGTKKRIFQWARRVGLEESVISFTNKPTSWRFSLANRLVFSKIKELLGFDQCKYMFVGAAPVSKSCLEYFLSLNMPLMNGYGMSECSSPASINSEWHCSIYSAGFPLFGTEMVIKDLEGKRVEPGVQGEICFRGRNKFMGYYKNEAASKSTIDSEGFIHSGDKGYMDSAGFVYITGRFKDLIITSGGENIPPTLIEDAVKAKCDIISQAFLIGDRRKFLSMIVTLKTAARAGETNDFLSPEAIESIKKIGVEAKAVSEVVNNPKVVEYVKSCIDEVNKNATSRAQEIKQFRLIDQDFSIAGGELTPTLKVKRNIVLEKYSKIIEEIYANPKL